MRTKTNGDRPNTMGAPITHGSCDTTSHNCLSTSGEIPLATTMVTCGRLVGAGLRRPASESVCQTARMADSVSGSSSSSIEWTISNHQFRQPVVVDSRRAHALELRLGQCRRTCGQHRPQRRQPASASRLPDSAGPGSVRPRPDHQTRTAESSGDASASNVKAVWLSVPRPAATTTSTGAARSTASRAASPVVTDLDEQAAGTLDQGQCSVGRHRADPTAPPRVGNARPARCAAATGASGSGYRHDPEVRHSRQPCDIGEVVVAVGGACLHRLAHRDVDARQTRVTRQSRRGDRLPDAGVGPGERRMLTRLRRARP